MTDSVQAGVGAGGTAPRLPSGTGAANADAGPENLPVGGGSAEARCAQTDPPETPPTAPVGPITHADAERALALVGNDLAVLQRRAEAAHQSAWARAYNGPSAQWLGHNLRKVRIDVACWLNPMIHKPPRRIEAAMVLLEAERRWNGVEAASWHPLAAMVAHGMARPAVPVLPQQVIARLAGRGITLLLGEDGTIRATPAGMLNETDRAQITEHKAEIVKALASAEVVA